MRDDLWDPAAEAAMGHIELARWADVVVVAPATAHFLGTLGGRLGRRPAVDGLPRDDGADRARARHESSDVGEPGRASQSRAARSARRALSRARDRRSSLRRDGPGPHARAERDRRGVARADGPAARAAAQGPQGRRHRGPDARADRSRSLHHEPQLGKDGLRRRGGGARSRRRRRARDGPRRVADARRRAAHRRRDGGADVPQRARRDRRRATSSSAARPSPTIGRAKRPSRRSNAAPPRWICALVRSPDTLASVAALPRPPFTVGFAAETHDVAAHARDKLERKRIDMIAANQVGPDCGFDRETNALTVYLAGGGELALGEGGKGQLARRLVDVIAERYRAARAVAKSSSRAG